jgi:hypothetical protein
MIQTSRYAYWKVPGLPGDYASYKASMSEERTIAVGRNGVPLQHVTLR